MIIENLESPQLPCVFPNGKIRKLRTYFSPGFPLVGAVAAAGPFVLLQEYLMDLSGQTRSEGETYKMHINIFSVSTKSVQYAIWLMKRLY